MDIISRDRAGAYAAAARKGAPQAQQIADRFHLLKNLREGLKELMDLRESSLPEVEEHHSDAIPASARGLKDKSEHQTAEQESELKPEKHYRTIPPYPDPRPAGTSSHEWLKQARREKRYARYEDVRTLHEQGVSLREISRRFNMGRDTVRRFIQAEQFPERAPSQKGQRGSILNQHKAYILQRWQQAYRNSVQLYDEIKARGYQGSPGLLRAFLSDLRKKHRQAGSAQVLLFDASRQAIEIPDTLPPLPRVVRRMSATRASWLFVRSREKLDEKQCQSVEQIRKGHPDLEKAYQLSQEFVMMLSERREADLDTWLVQAEQSGLPMFKKFVKGIRQDYAAVRAAFSSQWSNGQVEAQVNCLKRKPRIVFGRADFDLLRLRVLSRV